MIFLEDDGQGFDDDPCSSLGVVCDQLDYHQSFQFFDTPHHQCQYPSVCSFYLLEMNGSFWECAAVLVASSGAAPVALVAQRVFVDCQSS